MNDQAKAKSMLTRLVLGCLAPLVLGAVAHAWWTVNTQRQAMEQGLAAKASALGGLLVDVVGPSLAFDDVKAVQDGLAFLERDADFAWAAAWDAKGQPVTQRGAAPREVPGLPRDVRAVVERAQGRVVSVWPVQSDGKALGTVAVALRTAGLEAQLATMVRDSSLISLAAIVAAVAVVLALASVIQRRNRDMRRVLDSVQEAILMVKPDGTVEGEPSATARTWFHGVTVGEPVWRVVSRLDGRAGGWLELAWAELKEGLMPFDVLVDQLPRALTHGGRHFRVTWSPEREGEVVRAWLAVVVDVTGEVERARAEAQGRDLLQLVESVSKDRVGTAATLKEADRLVSAVVEGEAGPGLLRALHTLKGVCAVSGLSSMAALAHELEDEATQGPLEPASRSRLATTWMGLRERLGTLTGDTVQAPLEVSREDLERLRRVVEPLDGSAPALEALDALMHHPAERALGRLASQAGRIAERLGKGPVDVVVQAHDVRLPEAWQPFWASLVHVVRNALDHGLEPRVERLALGKSPLASLRLTASEGPSGLCITVADDGRGIDWKKVEQAARAKGLPADSHEALVEALFADGLSTKEQVTEVSGRGVGLAAVRDACRALGGDVEVEAQPGRGTTFRFRWPSRSPRPRLRLAV